MRLYMRFRKDMRMCAHPHKLHKSIIRILKIYAHMQKTAIAYAIIRTKPANPQPNAHL